MTKAIFWIAIFIGWVIMWAAGLVIGRLWWHPDNWEDNQ